MKKILIWAWIAIIVIGIPIYWKIKPCMIKTILGIAIVIFVVAISTWLAYRKTGEKGG